MKPIQYILPALLLFALISCSNDSSDSNSSYELRSEAPVATKQARRSAYLAYEHAITIGLPHDDLETGYGNIISFCNDDVANKCTILHSSLYTGDYSSAQIEIRVLPTGVDTLLKLVSDQGDISNKSTDIDDLQDAIVNGKKRLEMLIQYRSRLSHLEGQRGNNIESLIKIAKELSQVQSDIEYSQGGNAALLQRTQMDIVQISLDTHAYTSFWAPISQSFGGFGETLSEQISEAITAIAFLLPWALMGMVLLLLVRFIWQKSRVQ